MSIWGNPVMLGGSGGGGGDVPLLTRAEWNALPISQKRSYGLVAIDDANEGFEIGELVYGADYLDIPTLINAQYMNGSDGITRLSYSFVYSITYTIIISTLGGKNINGLSITLNNNNIEGSFVECGHHTYPDVIIYAATITVNKDDVLTVYNSSNTGNTGVQVFVFESVGITGITLVDAVGNDNTTFTIPQSNTAWYFEVAKYGYYSGGSTIPETRVFQCLAYNGQSTACPNYNIYWYGGTYVITLR